MFTSFILSVLPRRQAARYISSVVILSGPPFIILMYLSGLTGFASHGVPHFGHVGVNGRVSMTITVFVLSMWELYQFQDSEFN